VSKIIAIFSKGNGREGKYYKGTRIFEYAKNYEFYHCVQSFAVEYF